MKILSLKLDDNIYDDAEELIGKLKLARNRYINEAVATYNQINRRKLLKNQLIAESGATRKDSLKVLHEFEMLEDEN